MADGVTYTVRKSGKLHTEGQYGYVSGGGHSPSCSADVKPNPVSTGIYGHSKVPVDEAALLLAVYQQATISIGVDASGFQCMSLLAFPLPHLIIVHAINPHVYTALFCH